jgi:hypothetical protein
MAVSDTNYFVGASINRFFAARNSFSLSAPLSCNSASFFSSSANEELVWNCVANDWSTRAPPAFED